MNGLMMDDFPLTLVHIFERAGAYFGSTEIISRWPDGSIHRTTYAEFHQRAQKLGNALRRLGLAEGDRVATLGWNSSRHLEAYFGIPLAGGVFHTLNPRLPPAELAYIVNHAEDRVLLVDDVLLPVLDSFRGELQHSLQIIVWSHGTAVPAELLDYEAWIADELPRCIPQGVDERSAAGLCYTSGTTGRPRGVLYSHRSLALHSLGAALPDVLDVSMSSVILPVVPMFHANAWGIPFAGVMVGAKLVFPGPRLDAVSVLDLISNERVTLAAGVPTVWLALLEALDQEPERWNTRHLETLLVGGSAAPAAMIEGFEKRHGLSVLHAWGMTETAPLGTVSRLKPHLAAAAPEEQLRVRATQGLPSPFVELRAMGEAGPVPWDGKSMGELHVRGPWVAASYYKNPSEADKFTMDGWFRTGDIVTLDAEGYVRITDRSKDVIKSGGEWISSVDLENALMGHPAVREAAVVGMPHPKWDERPVACVVLREGAEATPDELREFLAGSFAKFQLPDAFVYLDQIPRTAAGKFLKSALRERLKSEALW